MFFPAQFSVRALRLMVLQCAVELKENADMLLSRIAAALRANYIVLLTCALMVFGALLISYALVSLAISTVRSYYVLLPASTTAESKTRKKSKAKSPAAADDVVYADDVEAAGQGSNLQDSDNSRIKASITRLKGKYSQYNAAMSEHATRAQGRTADDLMDETILSRGNDDFVYTSPKDKKN